VPNQCRIAALVAAALLPLQASQAQLIVDPAKYFAYTAIPRPSRMHAQEYVLLTRMPCKATGVSKDAKVAIYFALYESPGCWMKTDGGRLISICRTDNDGKGPIGNDCYDVPKDRFVDTSTLPRVPRF
jgi:hypothetical protein